MATGKIIEIKTTEKDVYPRGGAPRNFGDRQDHWRQALDRCRALASPTVPEGNGIMGILRKPVALVRTLTHLPHLPIF